MSTNAVEIKATIFPDATKMNAIGFMFGEQ
jgi:hypothetical protein